jgi:cytochrome c oxidase assembly protein subunit 15
MRGYNNTIATRIDMRKLIKMSNASGAYLTGENNNFIQFWLFFTAFMVFAMAVIGAITRLTESGLSMVEWKPLIGALPPLSQKEWDRVFSLYQQTPEFRLKNSWMGLEDFKRIFFWEWLHRLWGRLIGLVYALPLAWFWIKGMIPQGYKGKLLFILALGAMQGVMGWYMVMSGLVDRPDVSHFRLAAHLSLALVIFCCLVWVGLQIKALSHYPPPLPSPLVRGEGVGKMEGGKALDSLWGEEKVSFCLKRHGWIAFAFVCVTIIWGAFTAGLDGGMLYNTWPKMDAHWIPPEVTGIFAITHDPGAVQFFHRWIAVFTMIVVLTFAWRVKDRAIAGMVLLQVGLGISTVMTQVYIPLAALHQAGAIVLLALLVRRLKKI